MLQFLNFNHVYIWITLTAKELTNCVIPESRLSAKFKCVNLGPMCCVRNIRELIQTPLLPLLC